MNKKNIILSILICIISVAKAQINHNYFISAGLSLQKTKEMRYTSNFRSGIGYNVSLGYERETIKSINRLSILFIHAKQGKGNISFSNNLRPEVKYEYLRITNRDKAIGGYFDLGSLLAFRNGKRTDENSISYCLWSSLGISAQINKQINISDKSAVWTSRISLPILSYVVRPSYSFPYPDNFLEEGTFNFARSGLGKAIITGGKLKSIASFSNIRLQTGLNYVTGNKKWAYGLHYSLGYLQTKELKPLFQFNHQISVIAQKIRTK